MRSAFTLSFGIWAGIILRLSTCLADTASNDLFPPDVARNLNHGIANIMKEKNLPSVAVKLLVRGKGQYTFVGGFANLKTRTARTLDQPFRIASVTKTFTATAILVLVDRGLLQKNDPIAKWYPDFPNADQITVDDLLRMRSGIPAPNDDEVLAKVYDNPLAPATPLAEELSGFAALKSQFKAPNTEGVYTDFNYDILAGIVQQVTGKDIGMMISETVIKPLKLQHTSYPTGTALPGKLRGYGWNPETKRFEDKTLFNPPLGGASGAMISDISDLLKFSRALCHGELLKPETLREQMQGQLLLGAGTDYGEGVALGHGFCGHSGTINGFTTDMYYMEKLDASLVISVNRLDRDNESQSSPIYALLGKTILSTLVPAE
jgi:D-alanyl-D-alanine carboxypeptidase